MTDTFALNALAVDDINGNPHWNLAQLATLYGTQASTDMYVAVDAIKASFGADHVQTVDSVETVGGETLIRSYVRLSAMAAVSLLASNMALFPRATVEDISFFASRITSPVIANTPDGYDAPFGSSSTSAPDPDVVVLSSYLADKLGDYDRASRYVSSFGKSVKAAYTVAHGHAPETADVALGGDYVGPVCQYRTADLPVIDAAFNEWIAAHSAMR